MDSVGCTHRSAASSSWCASSANGSSDGSTACLGLPGRRGSRRRALQQLDQSFEPSESDKWVARERCSIYTWDLANATNNRLLPKYWPKQWLANKFSAELWLARALENHPWRTRDSSQADLVHLAANFSMYCRSGKLYSARFFWRAVLPLLGYTGKETPLLRPPFLAGTEKTPKMTVLTDNECTAPWAHTWKPHEIMMLTDHGPKKHDSVAPFVLSRPAWLVSPTGTVPDLGGGGVGAWTSRPLVFFTGHVPKLYISTTRYQIWRQIRRHPGVLAISATINCTIGQFAECANFKKENFSYFSYCRDYCSSHGEDDRRVMLKDAPGKKARVRQRCATGKNSMMRWCRAYRHVDYASELADMAASTRNLPLAGYFEAATRHRFCLNAPGDFVSTPKITEFVALGAAGGCLPVMVIRGHPRSMLPYTRWLDWCEIAILVSEETARTDMAKVLAKLEALSEADAERMRVRLRAVRNAFVWRPPHPTDPATYPSAADYLLAEGCTMARRFRADTQGVPMDPQLAARPKPPDAARCML